MIMTTENIINTISNSKKTTPVKIWIKGKFNSTDFLNIEFYQGVDYWVLFSDWKVIKPWLKKHDSKIKTIRVEADRRNSAIPLIDLLSLDARIEPGAYIREFSSIGKNVVVMMGAVINIGANVGDNTMIDMNAVIGGRAKIGRKCHIGAGAIVAGVIEPASAKPVVIEDNVLVGANAVILEGVRVGEHSVVAAGAIVTSDVPPYTVVAGAPAKQIKKVDAKTISKTSIEPTLRNIQ
ncbi:MAG: 2,3,4,5-tetrahydropyridine-2,6-dicarboxylate N-acetyltransferase [Caldisericia bacterium]|nr:2,3,4,5-tetrahydropyridine-2,6-dicarboxylate N-acetyltransferase [Caldisericia bacterium]